MSWTGGTARITGAYPQITRPRHPQLVSLASVAARASTPERDPGAPVPARARVGQRRAVADGQAARAAGAGGVLGLLSRQLAAHAALPQGMARALRRRRPPSDR